MQPYLECLAFRLDTKEGSICYTGDSGPQRQHRRAREGLRPADSHESLFQRHRADAGLSRGLRQPPRQRAIAKRAGAKTLVLVHLLAQIDQPGIREQIVHEIQEVYDGTVIWGEDLMKLGVVNAKVTTIETKQGDA